MDRQEREIDEIIAAAGGEQVRRRKHRIYRFSDGRVFVRSSTSSDYRSSLNTISDLKRFLATPLVIERTSESKGKHVLPFETFRRKHITQTPNPANQDAGVFIPSLGKLERKQHRLVRQFTSLDDLLTAADQVEDYWKLCSSGRVRTLQKLASCNFKTNTYTIMACRVGIKDLRTFQEDIESRDYNDALGLIRYIADSKNPVSYPALVIERGNEKQESLLIECAAAYAFNEIDQTAVAPLETATCGLRYAIWPIPSDKEGRAIEPWERYLPQQFYFYIVLSAQEARQVNLSFSACANWTDPAKTRPVVRQMLERLDDPKFAEARARFGNLLPDATAQIAAADSQSQPDDDETAMDVIAAPYLDTASAMVNKGMDGVTVSGAIVQALAYHILLTANEYDTYSGDLSETDVNKLAGLYASLLKDTLHKQYRRQDKAAEGFVSNLVTVGKINRVEIRADSSESDRIAKDLFDYLQRNGGNADLIANIKMLQVNTHTESEWRHAFLKTVYDAWQAKELAQNLAIASLVRMAALIQGEKTGPGTPSTPKGSAIFFEKFGLKACAQMALTDYKHFSQALEDGLERVLGDEYVRANNELEGVVESLMDAALAM